jgi:mRNA interferase MazF
VTAALRRGDVVLVRLDPSERRELRKTRPAVVLSNEAACACDAVVQIVPLAGWSERTLRPWEAAVDSPESGVGKPSRAVANQIRTVARVRLGRLLGHLTAVELATLERAVILQLGLPR